MKSLITITAQAAVGTALVLAATQGIGYLVVLGVWIVFNFVIIKLI